MDYRVTRNVEAGDIPSPFRKLAIRLLGVFVVLPVVVVAGYGGMAALLILTAMTHENWGERWVDQLARLGLALLVVVGLFGVRTGVRLYRHFILSTQPPPWARAAWRGLASASLANLLIMYWIPGPMLLMGWPLIGSAAFALLLLQSARRAGRSTGNI